MKKRFKNKQKQTITDSCKSLTFKFFSVKMTLEQKLRRKLLNYGIERETEKLLMKKFGLVF